MKKLLAVAMVFGASLSTVAFADHGHGGMGHGHGGYHHAPHRVTCIARNLRGMTFTATGRNRFNVQNRAVNKCYEAGSRVCRLAACY